MNHYRYTSVPGTRYQVDTPTPSHPYNVGMEHAVFHRSGSGGEARRLLTGQSDTAYAKGAGGLREVLSVSREGYCCCCS